jgi:excinuclease ABC subunit B
MSNEDLDKLISKNHRAMESAAKDLDFIEAARLRDEILELKKLQNK